MPVLRNAYNQLSKKVAKTVKYEKEQQWQTTCSELDYRNGTKFWQQFKRLAGLKKQTGKPHRVKDPNGVLTADDDSTAQVLADHLAKCHTPNAGPIFNEEFFENITQYIKEKQNLFTPQLEIRPENGDDDHNLLSSITPSLLMSLLKKCRNTSPGEDKITYKIITKAHPVVLDYLSSLYTYLRNIGYFPKHWKSAIGVMIPKTGKDVTVPGNNRPISLIKCVAKLFEKCISKPLINHLIDRNILNKWQRAYLPGKEANEHVLRLATHIRTAVECGWLTGAIFLDVEKAFDSVWQDGLRVKLTRIGIPNKIIRLLSSFLQDRTIAVKVGNTISRQVPLKAGTPQGSVLSPILFNIFVNDIPFAPECPVRISQFADDLAFWTSRRSKKGYKMIHLRLQECMKYLETWCSDWHVKLNPTKSQLMFFCKLTPKIPPDFTSITLFDTPIPITKQTKFLGLTLDAPRLSLIPHCKAKRAEAEHRANLLRRLRGTTWGCSVKTLVHLYKTFIRPVIETGYPATVCACKKAFHHLSVAEHHALRIAVKAYYEPGKSRMTNLAIRQKADIIDIKTRLEILHLKTLDRYIDSPLMKDLETDLDHMIINNKSITAKIKHADLLSDVAQYQNLLLSQTIIHDTTLSPNSSFSSSSP